MSGASSVCSCWVQAAPAFAVSPEISQLQDFKDADISIVGMVLSLPCTKKNTPFLFPFAKPCF